MLRARTAKKDFTALPLTECLAKTYRNAHGVTAAGRTVLDHALITGAVAGAPLGTAAEMHIAVLSRRGGSHSFRS